MNAAQAWLAAMGQLQSEMPKAAYDNWVAHTQLLSYDATNGEFSIGAPSAYARDWLENRLTSTLTRLLAGLLNQPAISLRFVTINEKVEPAPSEVENIQAEQAWQSALEQIRRELSEDVFDAWVSEIQFASFEDGAFIIAAPDAETRVWLESRLSSTFSRLLGSLLKQDVDVRFVVWSVDESPAPAFSPEAVGEEGDTSLQWMVDAIPGSLRDAITQSWRVVSINAYFLRWMPILGYHLWWLMVAFFQMLFFENGKDSDSREKTIIKASLSQLAKWSGSSRRSVFDLLANPDNQQKLRCFLQPLGAPLVNGERELVVYTNSSGESHQIQAGNRFLMLQPMPLTPHDAHHLQKLLLSLGIQTEPIAALEKAIDLPRSALLAGPVADQTPAALVERPEPVSVMDVVERSAGKAVPKSSRPVFYDLAEKLSKRIMPARDRIQISWYFILNWLPQSLSHGPAAAVVLLNDIWHYHHQIAELQASDQGCTIRELFPGVWLKRGYGDIAAWTGITPLTVRRWFSSENASSRPGKRETLDRFFQIQRQRNPALPGNPVQWLLNTELLEPLMPADQAIYEHWLSEYADLKERMDRLGSQPSAEVCKAFLDYLEGFLSRLKATLFPRRELPRQALKAWEDLADHLVSILHHPPEMVVSRLHHPPFFSVSVLHQPATNPVSRIHRPLDISVSDLHRLKHLVLNIIYVVITHTNPRVRQDLKPPQSAAAAASTPNTAGWGRGLPESWGWDFLLPASGIKSQKLRAVIQKNAPWIWVSHLLYGYGPAGKGIDDVIAVTLEELKAAPNTGRVGGYDILAQLPPTVLYDMLRQAIRSQGAAIGFAVWDEVMKGAKVAQLLQLAEKLRAPAAIADG